LSIALNGKPIAELLSQLPPDTGECALIWSHVDRLVFVLTTLEGRPGWVDLSSWLYAEICRQSLILVTTTW